MFLNTNDRIINLKNVSNINIVRDRDKNRIVFNLNYNIEMFTEYDGSHKKHISDYVYWDSVSTADFESNIGHLKDMQYFKDNFIEQVNSRGYINVNEISSIKFAEKKHRVIFNLSHPVTFKDHDGEERITSEFVYVNCKTFDKYKQYKQYVIQKLSDK